MFARKVLIERHCITITFFFFAILKKKKKNRILSGECKSVEKGTTPKNKCNLRENFGKMNLSLAVRSHLVLIEKRAS